MLRWYVRNSNLHGDLGVEMVAAVIKEFAKKCREHRLHDGVNVEGIQLLYQRGIVKRLKATRPFE